MKKFLAMIAIAGVFTACGNETETETSTNTDTTSTMMQAPMDTAMTPMMGDTTMRMDSTIR